VIADFASPASVSLEVEIVLFFVPFQHRSIDTVFAICNRSKYLGVTMKQSGFSLFRCQWQPFNDRKYPDYRQFATMDPTVPP